MMESSKSKQLNKSVKDTSQNKTKTSKTKSKAQEAPSKKEKPKTTPKLSKSAKAPAGKAAVSKTTSNGGKAKEEGKKNPESRKPAPKKFSAPLGVATTAGVRRSLRIDSKNVAVQSSKTEMADIKDYVQANEPTYLLLCNMWYCYILEATQHRDLAEELLSKIYDEGLIATIDASSTAADELLRSTEEVGQGIEVGSHNITDPLWREISSAISSNVSGKFSDDQDLLRWQAYMHACLEALRFPKRFSPAEAKKLIKDSVTSFLDVENRNKMLQRGKSADKALTSPLDARIREIISEMLRGYKCNPEEGYFSTGAQAVSNSSTSNSFGKKFLHAIGDTDICPARFTNYRILPKGCVSDTSQLDSVKIHVVPKSYKTGRVIGQEDSTKAWHAQAVNQALRAATLKSKWKKYFHYIDQEPNMESCQKGSLLGELATVDQSKASDTISWSFIAKFFPPKVVKDLQSVRPRYAKVDGSDELRLLQMAFSSGHACTATIETIVFLAIDIAVAEYCAMLQGIPVKTYVNPQSIVVYNDDQVVPCDIVDTLVQVHERYGLEANTSKSFWKGSYREACGTEYYFGLPVHHNWFPRHTFVWDESSGPETYAALIKLQEKCTTRESRVYLAEFITSWVRYCGQRPTYSRAMCENTVDIVSPYKGLVSTTKSDTMRKGKIIKITLPLNTELDGNIDNHFRHWGLNSIDKCLYNENYVFSNRGVFKRGDWGSPVSTVDFPGFYPTSARSTISHLKVAKREHIPTASENYNEDWFISNIGYSQPMTVVQLSYLINRELGLDSCGKMGVEATWSYLRMNRDINPESGKRASLYIIQWRAVTPKGKPGKIMLAPDCSFEGVKHLGIKASYGTTPLKNAEIREQLDLYRYMHFLRKGPTFDDKLSELLGVSSTPVTAEELWNGSTIAWKVHIER